MLFECNSGIRLLLLLLWILGVLDKSIFRHCNWSRDALVLGVFRTVQIHGRRPKKTPRKKTERLSRFVWRRSAGLPRTSAEKFICVQMALSPSSDIQMRWFQFEELDIEVTYNTFEDERNRSYESKVMAILLKCVGAVLKWLIRGHTRASGHIDARVVWWFRVRKPFRGLARFGPCFLAKFTLF